MKSLFKFFITLVFFAIIEKTYSHGLCSWPRSRGLIGSNFKGLPILRKGAKINYAAQGLNAGGRYTVSHGFSHQWTPYEPNDRHYPFRHDHGMCGDQIGWKDNMAPYGQFYNGLTIATYEEGDYIDMETYISAHHLGYFEFYICSLDCCHSSDIGENCFKKGCCHKLTRVALPSCESGFDRECGPIDWRYAGRWYLPPASMRDPYNNWYGGRSRKMRYYLPKGLMCERCVVHWYWACANFCNPPGYAEYHFPWRWKGIPGEGGARGSINRRHRTCGKGKWDFPEEFWACSENIRIAPRNGGKSRTPQFFHDGEMSIEGPYY